MGRIIHRPAITPHALEENVCDIPEVSIHVPFQHPVETPLPEENGREQFSIREDGLSVEPSLHHDCGWTIEYKALVECEWADFWVVPMIYQAEDRNSMYQPRQQAAVNLLLDQALHCAKHMNDAQKRSEKKGEGRTMGIIRIRHQHSGNVILADII